MKIKCESVRDVVLHLTLHTHGFSPFVIKHLHIHGTNNNRSTIAAALRAELSNED